MRPAQEVSSTSSLAPLKPRKRTSSYAAAGTRTDAIRRSGSGACCGRGGRPAAPTGQLGRAEGIIQLPERQQIGIGSGGGIADLQYGTVVEVESWRGGFLSSAMVGREPMTVRC